MTSSSKHRSGARERSTVFLSAVLGASLAAGWTLHDHLLFVIADGPRETLALIVPSLVAVLVGGLLGLVLGLDRRLALVVLGLLVLVAGLPLIVPLPLGEIPTMGVRSYALIGLGVLAGRVARSRLGFPPVLFGLATGAILCVLKTAYRLPEVQTTSWYLVAGCLVALVAGALRAPLARWGLLAVAVFLPVHRIVPRIVHYWTPGRADQELRAASFSPDDPSLLVVVLDTVRADHLSVYGYERRTSPGLEDFASRHATLYSDVRSTTSWTLPSHATLLTGLPPAVHGATHPRVHPEAALNLAERPAQPLRTDVPTLPELLAARGYRTGAIVANHAYLDYRFGLDRGFEHYDDRASAWVRRYMALGQMLGLDRRLGHVAYRDAAIITDQGLAWIEDAEERERPFFLLLNYMDAHDPCYPPAPYDELFSDRQPVDPIRAGRSMLELLYDRSLAYLDAEVARLLGHLEASGRLDEMAVVVTADHGEAFGEHDYWSHAWTLYDEVLHVPLLVKPAGGRTAERNDDRLGLVEVHDLLLELVGLDVPSREPPTVIGEWYHPQHEPKRPIRLWAERVGRSLDADLVTWIDDQDVKWITSSDGTVEAYDIVDDPDELSPLPLTEAQVAEALAIARTWWEAHPPLEIRMERLDEEMLEGMKDLGYVGDDPDG